MDINNTLTKDQIIRGIRLCEALKIELGKENGTGLRIKAIDAKQSVFENMLRDKQSEQRRGAK